jgi:hypothetical protein
MQSVFFSECKECPSPLKVVILENVFEENAIETGLQIVVNNRHVIP